MTKYIKLKDNSDNHLKIVDTDHDIAVVEITAKTDDSSSSSSSQAFTFDGDLEALDGKYILIKDSETGDIIGGGVASTVTSNGSIDSIDIEETTITSFLGMPIFIQSAVYFYKNKTGRMYASRGCLASYQHFITITSDSGIKCYFTFESPTYSTELDTLTDLSTALKDKKVIACGLNSGMVIVYVSGENGHVVINSLDNTVGLNSVNVNDDFTITDVVTVSNIIS